jgi:hypothetical protein
MEPGCTCTYSGESLRRNDLYYISRLHDNVLRHMFNSLKATCFIFLHIIFNAHGLCYYMYKCIVSSRVDLQTSDDMDASPDPGLPKLVFHQMSTLRLLHS